MQYRVDKKTGRKLSVLGLGCMRFPRTIAGIDMKKAEGIIMAAVEGGVNYFDTAWMYQGSEEALGAVLEKNRIRDRVFIASKLPVVLVKKPEDFGRFFGEELRRLRTDCIDYYLMHMLTGLASWEKLTGMGIEGWIASEKKSGRIGQIGFSFHGAAGEFLKILDAYPWEFCQIQYNYSDEHFQAGIGGLKKAAETMPVIIMEPLLGGKLAQGLPREALDIFRAFPRNGSGGAGAGPEKGRPCPAVYSPAAWGLRWVWNHPEAAVVLSGMSDSRQVEENAALADNCAAGSLTAEELDVYRRVREVFNASCRVRCTGCGYCMPCPRHVNIPGCFAAYNTSFFMGWMAGMQQYMTSAAFAFENSFGPGNCIACGKCETCCPQKIPIIAGLRELRKRMEPLPVRIVIAAMRKFLGRKRRSTPAA
ncbi:MAG: aldo/keto reductase [Treponema sp.]|nr:aldo/keto reductase [Treponema sp.]